MTILFTHARAAPSSQIFLIILAIVKAHDGRFAKPGDDDAWKAGDRLL